MSRGLTDVPMIVVGNKSDLLRRDMASDKFRHDVINKVKKTHHFVKIIIFSPKNVNSFARKGKLREIVNVNLSM